MTKDWRAATRRGGPRIEPNDPEALYDLECLITPCEHGDMQPGERNPVRDLRPLRRRAGASRMFRTALELAGGRPADVECVPGAGRNIVKLAGARESLANGGSGP